MDIVMQPFSHHSSNPLEARSSDNLNADYNRLYAIAVSQQHQQRATAHHPSDAILLSSEDPLHGYDAPDQHSQLKKYQQHVADVVSHTIRKPVVTLKLGPPPKSMEVDLDEDMGSDDELTRPFTADDDAVVLSKPKVTVKKPTTSTHPYKQEWIDHNDVVVDNPDQPDLNDEDEHENQYNEHPCGHGFVNEDAEMIEQDENEEQQERRFSSPFSSPLSSPLTPLSSLPSSPVSSRPPSPTESLSGRPQDEQEEIIQEILHLNSAIPFLAENYEVIDRLGTGTFSSVYKAIDLRYNEWDNKPWKGNHPPESSAYYQSAGPGYRGRGGRGAGIGKDKGRGNSAGQDSNTITLPEASGAREDKVHVAIKRIYTTSGPERIRNELAIMQSCRGCRHTSQIITAYRHLDQVALVLPYQRNMDFRDFYQTLPLEGIKSYFRCLFRALRDIHARGIIHRDVKPANFLYDPYTGIGTLCDFGLASVRMENGQLVGQCYHTPASPDDPHGKNRVLTLAQTEEVKKAQREARLTNTKPSEKVGYPENDRRVISKANRAGTRGFRAPEVLLKCGAQTGAIDVWSVGVILLFFLTGKFPIFQSNDDIEGLMEIAVIIGRRQMERTATLHSRILSTNIPSLESEGITWQKFVEKLNPKVWQLRDCDMRFYPHRSKHRDGRNRSGWQDTTPVSDDAAPMTSAPTTANTTSTMKPNTDPLQRHIREFRVVFNLLEKLLHPESTKRCTPRTALFHPMLAETATTAPPPPLSDAWAAKVGKFREGDDAYFPHVLGDGVCGDWHFKDEVTELDSVRILKKCLCLRGGSCVGSGSEDGSEMEEEKEEKRWCGRYTEQVVEPIPGEGIAIGDRPCEYHEDDVYANSSSITMME